MFPKKSVIFDKIVQSMRDDTTLHLGNDLQFSKLFHVDPRSSFMGRAGWILLVLFPQEKTEVTPFFRSGTPAGF